MSRTLPPAGGSNRLVMSLFFSSRFTSSLYLRRHLSAVWSELRFQCLKWREMRMLFKERSWCIEYGSQSIEDSQADIAILRRKVLVAGAAAGVWAYNKHKQKSNVHIMVLNLVRGVPLTPKEKQTLLDLLSPSPQRITSS